MQQEVGITFVYVTHDQEEALTMSDRIAVMASGQVEQIGTPKDVYEEPATVFVADFLGVSNLMDGEVTGRDGNALRVRVGEVELRAERGEVATTGPAKVVIRPERIELEVYGENGANRLPGMVERVVYVGAAQQLVIRLATGEQLQALVQNDGAPLAWEQGTPVRVHFPPSALRVLELGADAPAATADEG